jgi:hypothetical protein
LGALTTEANRQQQSNCVPDHQQRLRITFISNDRLTLANTLDMTSPSISPFMKIFAGFKLVQRAYTATRRILAQQYQKHKTPARLFTANTVHCPLEDVVVSDTTENIQLHSRCPSVERSPPASICLAW